MRKHKNFRQQDRHLSNIKCNQETENNILLEPLQGRQGSNKNKGGEKARFTMRLFGI